MENRGIETALTILHDFDYCVRDALLCLMKRGNRHNHEIAWSKAEIEAFSSAFFRYGKNFFLIRRKVPTRKVSELVQYYYRWKKQFPSKYKKVKEARELRSTALDESDQDSTYAPSSCASTTRRFKPKPKTKYSATLRAALGTNKPKRNYRKRGEKKWCCNCYAPETPCWRKDPDNSSKVLCNACGVYKIKYGKERDVKSSELQQNKALLAEAQSRYEEKSGSTTPVLSTYDDVSLEAPEAAKERNVNVPPNLSKEPVLNANLGHVKAPVAKRNFQEDSLQNKKSKTEIEGPDYHPVVIRKNHDAPGSCAVCSKSTADTWILSKKGIVCNACHFTPTDAAKL